MYSFADTYNVTFKVKFIQCYKFILNNKYLFNFQLKFLAWALIYLRDKWKMFTMQIDNYEFCDLRLILTSFFPQHQPTISKENKTKQNK